MSPSSWGSGLFHCPIIFGGVSMNILKIIIIFIISLFFILSPFSAHAESCDVNPVWNDYLMEYWIVFEDGKTSVGSESKRQFLITSDNEFYFYPDNTGNFLFSSSAFDEQYVPLHSSGVYYYGWNGDGYDVTTVVSLSAELNVIESYYSNFDIKHYTDSNHYDLILPKTNIVGVDITNSMGLFRYDIFRNNIPLLVTVGICILISFISIIIIKRVIYNFI